MVLDPTKMSSMIKIIDLQGQNSAGGRRESNENNNNLSNLQSLSNMLTGNTDSKQGGTKKSARQAAKRFFRP